MTTPEEYAKRLTLRGYHESAALVQLARRQCAALVRAAILEERERIAVRFDDAARLDPNERFPPAAIAAAIRELPDP